MGCYLSLEGDDHGGGDGNIIHRPPTLREVGTNKNQLKLLHLEDEQFQSDPSGNDTGIELDENGYERTPLSGAQRRKYIEQLQRRKEKKHRKLERARQKHEQMLIQEENELTSEFNKHASSAGHSDMSPQSGLLASSRDFSNSLLNSGRRKRHGVNQDGVEVESNGGRLTPIDENPKQSNALNATSNRAGMSHPRDERFNALRAWIDESQKENLSDPQKMAE